LITWLLPLQSLLSIWWNRYKAANQTVRKGTFHYGSSSILQIEPATYSQKPIQFFND
jgi:hypothetical protein